MASLAMSSFVALAPVALKPSLKARFLRAKTGSNQRTLVVAMVTPEMRKAIQEKIAEAEALSADPDHKAESAAAWDVVEEMSAASAHADARAVANNTDDPLENYCEDNPSADECRVYSD